MAASSALAVRTEVAAAAAAAAFARTAAACPAVVAVLADTACLVVEASVVPSGSVAEALLVAAAEAAFSWAAAWADFAFQVDLVAVACPALRRAFVVVEAAAEVIDRRKVPIDLAAPRPAELAFASGLCSAVGAERFRRFAAP